MFLPDYFEKYSIDKEKALAYGFSEQEEAYHYDQLILDGDFKLYVTVQGKEVDFWLVDQETGDDYVQLHMDQMVGQYVGQVREACQQALEDIRSSCFAVKDFMYPQTKRLVDWISQQYDRPLEYLWNRSPDSGVFRHQENLKWFGVLMKIDWSKLDARQEGKIEVLNLKLDQVSQLLEETPFYPAYHMNKKYWISIPLDERVEDNYLFELVAKSWTLTKK